MFLDNATSVVKVSRLYIFILLAFADLFQAVNLNTERYIFGA
jgi:hypothetical protein